MGAKTRGMPVVGIVSEKHCREAKPGHPSGKKLVDVSLWGLLVDEWRDRNG